MKYLSLVLVLCAASFAKDKNLADYPLRAHLFSRHIDREKGPIRTTTYTTIDFEVGATIYTTESGCKDLIVGTDYPAKVNSKRLTLLNHDRVCKMNILDVREK